MRRTLAAITVAAITVGLIGAGTSWAADAPQVYTKKCQACHSIAGVAGPMVKMGGPLDGVGTKRDEAWLRAYFKDPKAKIPESKMPKLTLSDDDWNAVVAYMLTLK
jgi:cytochrome c2